MRQTYFVLKSYKWSSSISRDEENISLKLQLKERDLPKFLSLIVNRLRFLEKKQAAITFCRSRKEVGSNHVKRNGTLRVIDL